MRKKTRFEIGSSSHYSVDMDFSTNPPPRGDRSNPAPGSPTRGGAGGGDRRPGSGHHLATIGHDGRFWEVHVEFEDDPRHPGSYRARLRFTPADLNEGEKPVRTATIIIEPSLEDAMRKARAFRDEQLKLLLDSALATS